MNDPYDSYITDIEPVKPVKKPTKESKKEPISTWLLLISLIVKLAIVGCIVEEALR